MQKLAHDQNDGCKCAGSCCCGKPKSHAVNRFSVLSLLHFHTLLHNIAELGDTDTALCLVLALRPSHIHLSTQRGEQVVAPKQCFSPKKVPLQEPYL